MQRPMLINHRSLTGGQFVRITDYLATGRPSFSFEFSPPQTPVGMRTLLRTAADLKELGPSFVSVTYGAGGGTRRNTIEAVTRIKHELGIEAMAHLNAAGHSRADVREILSQLRDSGFENANLLRGDPPRGEDSFIPAPDGFRYGSELVRFAREEGFEFCLTSGSYPEGHLESES
jgi:methylenetetrahydrofolate reductase (NADPH)